MSRDNWQRYHDEIFVGKQYDRGIKKDHYKVVMDIGANVGHFCDYIHDKADVIYAIEPGAENYEELLKNIEEKKLTKVKPFNVGLATDDGEMQYDPFAESSHWCHQDYSDTIKVRSLASFVKEHDIKQIDLLKIDCEGCERDVFAINLQEIPVKILEIVGELHVGFDDRIFEMLGYKYENVGGLFYAYLDEAKLPILSDGEETVIQRKDPASLS